jgi:hypothetical protein
MINLTILYVGTHQSFNIKIQKKPPFTSKRIPLKGGAFGEFFENVRILLWTYIFQS